jgi:hypothetical protein
MTQQEIDGSEQISVAAYQLAALTSPAQIAIAEADHIQAAAE